MPIKPEYKEELCVTLLTEMLAYQFAYPVRWIETQEVILNDFKSQKIIEVGPSPILTNMAMRTINATAHREMAVGTLPKKEVYCTSNHLDKIYYNREPPIEKFVENTDAERELSPPRDSKMSDMTPPTTVSSSISNYRLSVDVILSANHLIKAIVSSKLAGSSFSELDMTKTLRDLSQGRSTLQNEIKSDILKEFGSLIDENIDDIPLNEVCTDVAVDSLGPVTLPQVMKFVGKNLVGRFSTLKGLRSYLTKEWSMVDPNPFLVYLAYENASVNVRFFSDALSKVFIDDCCHSFAASENASIICKEDSEDNSELADGEKVRTVSLEEFELFSDDLRLLHVQENKLLSTHLSQTPNNHEIGQLKEELEKMQKKFFSLQEEFGNELLNESVNFMFSPKKVRIFASSWNWVRQDVLKLCCLGVDDYTAGSLVDIRKRIKYISNRIDPISLEMLQYHSDNNCKNKRWKQLLNLITDECKKSIRSNSIYTSNLQTAETHTSNSEKVHLLDTQKSLEQYVKTISLGKGGKETEKNTSVVSTKLDTDVSSYYKIETELFQVYSKVIQYALVSSNYRPADLWIQFKSLYEQLLIFLKNSDQIASHFRAIVTDALSAINKPLYSKHESIFVEDYIVDSSSDEECDISADEDSTISEPLKTDAIDPSADISANTKESSTIPVGVIPFLHIKRHSNTNENWVYDKAYTQIFLNNLLSIGHEGLSLFGKSLLLLVPKLNNNFVCEIIRALIQTGATVIIATQDFNSITTKTLQDIYHQYGARGSKMVVLPSNLASKVDMQKLCDYVYSNYDDLDYLIPLNTPSQGSSAIDISSEDELHIRSSLLNILRLLGNIVQLKKSKGTETRPTFVLLPLSPINGSKSSDGFISESYSSFYKVLDMWHVEKWKNEISICGCVYGWTMEPTEENLMSNENLDQFGIRTFSPGEMAFNILGLLTYDIVSLSQKSPIVADLNGGLHTLPSVMTVISAMKSHIREQTLIDKVLREEKLSDNFNVKGEFGLVMDKASVSPKGNINIKFPQLQEYAELRNNFNGSLLEGLIDPSHMVVVTGFSEIGPWGNSRTRWEMESAGEFSLEGCIEMAWIMGLIKYTKSSAYCGWIDSKTGQPVDGVEIKTLFEPIILKHSGIRFVEPELFRGYNPSQKQMLQEVVLNYDLEPVRISEELAEQYKLELGDKVEVMPLGDEECLIKFLKGALLYIPKALDIERMVAGQIPTGWDARSYGIPDDIVSQVDPITLFALVSTADALICAGITDPYEMYKYVHVSELGNCVGSGIGGLKSHYDMQLLRTKGEAVQSDILPETFINVTAAWINMLLISSSGPIKTPVGACATAVESLEMGCETIRAGKAKVCIVGGVDDFQENLSHEFANMGATSNSTEEMEKGRDPSEMCRPATSTRNGFMESQGGGIQIIMRGDIALQMGVPIYGVIGMTSTASDKISKSLPAPGKGILTCAREVAKKPQFGIPKLDINYRKRQLESRKREIKHWAEDETVFGSQPEMVNELAQKQIVEAKCHWGSDFWVNDPNIAPIRGALSVFGLDIDDLNVISCHGTSTKANEKNEVQIVHKMMEHLGRTKGNPLLAVFQKYLTGHPKGAAGAWMLNGCLQMINNSLVPGNRNADDIDSSFEQFDHLVFPSSPLSLDTIKACMLTSFGFGQKGAMALVLNPNYILASLSENEYNCYSKKRNIRERVVQNHFIDGIINNRIFQIKQQPPYKKGEEEKVYLDPLRRFNSESYI